MRRFALVLLVAVPAAAPAADPPPEQLAFFEKKIRPVFVEHCYKCHAAGSEKIRGGLTLDTRAGLLAGGDTGAALIPGDPAKSHLVKVLKTKDETTRMPPAGPLPAATIADIEAWVKMGAPDPRDGAAKGGRQEIDIAKGREFWAFRPVAKPAPPAAGDWATTPIDQFILAALTAKNISPVPDADAYTLVRRMYLDITGLPPTPAEVAAFAADPSAAGREKLVDQLLASPAFGERWGRHWLDVARFGESTGKSVNFNYPHAWRYRDYVIASFNSDKPFDRFAREQLAGDLMPAKTDAEKAAATVATGFLALGTKSLNERNRLQYEMDLADEQIDTTTQAFLGLTVACARCHDHKFDPIRQSDYYALAGIFRSTETCYGTIRAVQGQHPSPLLPLPATEPAGLPKLTSAERTRLEAQLTEFKAGLKESPVSAAGVRARIQVSMLEAKLGMYDADGTPKRQAMGVREKFRAADSPVFARGEIDKPGKPVPRGLPEVVTAKPTTIKVGSGRKELAEWVASPANPLTARVYVNRVWQHLFGRGLVATPDNFGATGTPPANPQLLDYLAATFVERGWSTKQLVKELVLSHTYRLSSRYDSRGFDADPDNTLNWRMTPGRLDAEVIRDAMLAVSGKLDRTPPAGSSVSLGGEGYAAVQRRGALFGRVPEDETHRSVYLPAVRDNLPESLALFDAADPSMVTGERSNTTVPGQALFLMNNPFVLKQAEAAAAKVLAAASTDPERAKIAYTLFFNRPATPSEITRLTAFTAKGRPREAWPAACQAMFGSAEFLMRQ